MSKRDKLSGSDPFGLGGSEAGEVSFQQAADALFGGTDLAKVDAGREVIKPIPIEQIYPDPMQPRRAMPSSLREKVKVQPDNLPEVFNLWIGLIEEESGRELSIDAFLQGSAQVQRPDIVGPVEAAFLDLVELAVSIRRDSLTNPITVARLGRNYRLETGERRWLAFHLLHGYFNGHDGKPNESDRWSKIPARVMDTVSVWRQATENTARQNLNAIGRARQFALLLMDLLGADNFQTFDQFDHEGDFYGQVADGNEWRIPRGSGEALLNAMGLKNESQLRYYRALLRLPPSVWAKADDYNTAVRTLRLCLQESAGNEAKLLALIESARLKDTVSMDTVSENDLDTEKSQHPPTPPDVQGVTMKIRHNFDKFCHDFDRAARKLSRGGESDRLTLSQMIDDFDKQLAEWKRLFRS